MYIRAAHVFVAGLSVHCTSEMGYCTSLSTSHIDLFDIGHSPRHVIPRRYVVQVAVQ